MNKLKIIKIIVFMLTFLIVFVLCAGITQVIKNSGQKNNLINVPVAECENIVEIFPMNNRLAVLTDQSHIHIINVESARVEGVINFQRSVHNGQKEKKEE